MSWVEIRKFVPEVLTVFVQVEVVFLNRRITPVAVMGYFKCVFDVYSLCHLANSFFWCKLCPGVYRR